MFILSWSGGKPRKGTVMAANKNPLSGKQGPEIPTANRDLSHPEHAQTNPIAESSFEKASKAFFRIRDSLTQQ